MARLNGLASMIFPVWKDRDPSRALAAGCGGCLHPLSPGLHQPTVGPTDGHGESREQPPLPADGLPGPERRLSAPAAQEALLSGRAGKRLAHDAKVQATHQGAAFAGPAQHRFRCLYSRDQRETTRASFSAQAMSLQGLLTLESPQAPLSPLSPPWGDRSEEEGWSAS